MYAADTDWCLYCGQHVDGTAPYCSADCLNSDRPTISTPPLPFCTSPSSFHTLSDTDDAAAAEVAYHDTREIQTTMHWSGGDRSGIEAWAAAIPSGATDGTSSPMSSRNSSRAPSPQPMRTPKLLLNHRRPVAPSLCMSTPQPTCPKPSRPMFTPQQSIASLHLAKSSADAGSMSVTSLLSGITDSFVATPSSASVADPIAEHERYGRPAAMLEALATHVRSWVSPQPQIKYALSSSQGLKPHVLEPAMLDESGAYPGTPDELSGQDAWWASEGGSVVGKKITTPATKRKSSDKTKGRSSTQQSGAHGTPREDHPAYHARGRKVSRPFC